MLIEKSLFELENVGQLLSFVALPTRALPVNCVRRSRPRFPLLA